MFTAQINQKLKSSNLDKSNDQVMNNDLLCRPKSNFWRKKIHKIRKVFFESTRRNICERFCFVTDNEHVC